VFDSDLHVHTVLSGHGSPEATPDTMLAAAKAAGLKVIGFSDHVIFPEHRSRPGILRLQLPHQADGMRVYVGCEADVISPTEISVDAAFALTLDYVLMSASHLYVPPGTGHPVEGMDPPAMAAYIISAMNRAVESGLADVIAHPFCVPAGPYDFGTLVGAADPERVAKLGERAMKAGVAIEYNPNVLRHWPQAAKWLYRRLLETGVKVSVNSDAHSPGGVGCRGPGYATEAEMRAEGIGEDRLWSVEDRVSAGRRRV